MTASKCFLKHSSTARARSRCCSKPSSPFLPLHHASRTPLSKRWRVRRSYVETIETTCTIETTTSSFGSRWLCPHNVRSKYVSGSLASLGIMKRRVLMLTLASVWQVAFAPLQRSSDSTFRISLVVLLSRNLLPRHTRMPPFLHGTSLWSYCKFSTVSINNNEPFSFCECLEYKMEGSHERKSVICIVH
jgi:hypothetical protein